MRVERGGRDSERRGKRQSGNRDEGDIEDERGRVEDRARREGGTE